MTDRGDGPLHPPGASAVDAAVRSAVERFAGDRPRVSRGRRSGRWPWRLAVAQRRALRGQQMIAVATLEIRSRFARRRMDRTAAMLDSRPMQPSVSMETPAGVRCWNRPDASARSHTSTLPALRKSSHVDGGAALGVMWRRASAIPRERFSPRGVIGRVAPEAPFSPSKAPGSPRSHDRIHAFAGIELACASATIRSPAAPSSSPQAGRRLIRRELAIAYAEPVPGVWRSPPSEPPRDV